jgi:hypothetical protein
MQKKKFVFFIHFVHKIILDKNFLYTLCFKKKIKTKYHVRLCVQSGAKCVKNIYLATHEFYIFNN